MAGDWSPPDYRQLPWPAWPKRPGADAVLPEPTAFTLHDHLVEDHGCQRNVVDLFGVRDWAEWHDAFHRRCADTVNHLHPRYVKKAKK